MRFDYKSCNTVVVKLVIIILFEKDSSTCNTVVVCRISPLHSELEALLWAMECMLQVSTCQSFGTDCKELIAMTKDPGAWPSFSAELEEFMKLKARFSEFSIIFVPRQENVSSDSLAKIARSFHRDLYYIGCSVPVWFPRPPQA